MFSTSSAVAYHAAVCALEPYLARAAVRDTYGGWARGADRRALEEEWAIELINECSPYSWVAGFDRLAWIKEWQSFWRLLACRHAESADSDWFVVFDIANFYDSIDHGMLLDRITHVAPEQELAISVIEKVLVSWHPSRFSCPRRGGLPMDLVGHGSRVLANFFLTPFDGEVSRRAQDADGHFMRFCDDMVLHAPSRRLAEELLMVAWSGPPN